MKIAIALLLVLTVQKDPTASDVSAALAGGSVAVYATINNPTMYDVFVVSGTSESAGKVELVNVDKPVTSITVPSFGSAELKAGAMFVRLSELKGGVKAGSSLNVTLTTDGGIEIPLAAVVK